MNTLQIHPPTSIKDHRYVEDRRPMQRNISNNTIQIDTILGEYTKEQIGSKLRMFTWICQPGGKMMKQYSILTLYKKIDNTIFTIPKKTTRK